MDEAGLEPEAQAEAGASGLVRQEQAQTPVAMYCLIAATVRSTSAIVL